MHHSVVVSVDEQFSFTSKFKSKLYLSILIGIVLFIVGILFAAFSGADHHEGSEHVAEAVSSSHHSFHWMQRVWANLWLNSVFFTGISVMGLFFVAVQYVAWAGWSSLIKRIPEAFGSFLPFAAISVILVFTFGHHDLFHWTHHYLYEPFLADGKTLNTEYDLILVGKSGYLNIPFFMVRMFLYFVIWIGMWFLLRRQSLAEDLNGGDSYYNKSIYLSAIFIIFFGVTSSTCAWDWIMSIDPHWFSTLFGWYVFASWWVTCLAAITLCVILLKNNGYLKAVTENHIHDLGKLVFAFSIFWTYLWFSQFLLIFYANIPEETVYFIDRWQALDGTYTFLFFFNIIINFFFPFLALMTRDAKRKIVILTVVVCGVIFGHYLDFYNMIMPGTLKANAGFGFIEIGALLTYGSLFILVISNTLSKTKLIAANHPLLKEALHHNI